MMSNQQCAINYYADKLRDTYNVQIPITNMEDIVSKIGGIVKYDARCCGYIEKNRKLITIHVEDNDDYRIKNFSIAQQLGKAFLYTDFIIDRKSFWEANSIVFDESFYKNRKNYCIDGYEDRNIDWINEFAGAFIMPKAEFKEKVLENLDKTTKDVDTKEIAKYFDVTVSTASWRGKHLGLFRY